MAKLHYTEENSNENNYSNIVASNKGKITGRCSRGTVSLCWAVAFWENCMVPTQF